MVTCAASFTKGFKALRSRGREDTPTQYHRSPERAAGALKDSISTPSEASSPKQNRQETVSVILKQDKHIYLVIGSHNLGPAYSQI